MSDSLKFGTSGLRGLAVDLVGEAARRYTAAFLRHLESTDRRADAVLVGADLRASSPDIVRSVMEAIGGAGATAIDCGALPTPALALEALSRGLPAVMVTGSHIPADRNGLKFYSASGEIDKADEAGILASLPSGDVPVAGTIAEDGSAALSRYLDRYKGVLGDEALRGWRVGVWQHSSVARDVLVRLLQDTGADIVALGRSDAFVPVDTEAVSTETQAELAGWVRAHQLDAVVSTDGDADRPLLVDEAGALVRGDVLGILTARFVGARTVVTPVTSNSAIEETGEFAAVRRTRVGSPFVIAAMSEAGAEAPVVGFEANGGVLLGSEVTVNGHVVGALPTRDAALPILAVLGLARAGRMTIGELVATLPPRIARSGRLEHVAPERSAALMALLRNDAPGFLAAQGRITATSEIDGLRFTLSSGDVIHYRPSGNAPELRCYTEASTAERADALLAWGLKAAEAVVR